MMRSIHRSSLIFILAIGLVTMDACRKKYEATSEDMVEYGWTLYEADDYFNSVTWFNEARIEDSKWKDAYNGLGWTWAKLMDLDSSIANFATGLEQEQDKWNPVDIQAEILAGLTFAYNAKGNDAKTIQYGRTFLDSMEIKTVKPLKPTWTFSHDPDSLLNHLDLRVTLAASYFATGKFDSTILQIKVIIDEINYPNVAVTDTTLNGRKLMAEQIKAIQKELRIK